MRIKVNIKSPRGWGFKVAATMARLGHSLVFGDSDALRLFRFHYPTVPAALGDNADIALMSSLRPIADEGKPTIALMEHLSYEFLSTVGRIKERCVVWTPNEMYLGILSALGIHGVLWEGGIEEEAFCVHPQGCLEKANWIATIDVDALSTLADEAVLAEIAERFKDTRIFALSESLAHTFWDKTGRRDIYTYKRTPHPAALYPFLSLCKVVILQKPQDCEFPFLPAVGISAAKSCNTTVVLLGFKGIIKEEPPFVYAADSTDGLLKMLPELLSRPPLQSAKSIQELREKNNLKHSVAIYLEHTLRVLEVL